MRHTLGEPDTFRLRYRQALIECVAEAIRQVASAVRDGDLILDGVAGLEEAASRLGRIPGIGDWTAQYIAMRALHEPDAFPATDLGIRRALSPKSKPLREAEILSRAEAWRPWRAYAAMHLWTSLSDGKKE